jgi:Arylsulfotransferase (ASST)
MTDRQRGRAVADRSMTDHADQPPTTPVAQPARRIDRRRFLAALGAGGAAAGIAACGGSGSTRTPHGHRRPITPTLPATESRRLLSVPELKPPPIEVSRRPSEPGLGTYVFTDVHAGYGQQGPLIIDRAGRLVYFKPVSTGGTTTRRAFNVRVQPYRGEPVLTHWIGATVYGHGQGHYELYDQRYRLVAQVHAGNGYLGDLHEFRLTDRGTALLTAYGETTGDLPAGPDAAARVGPYFYGVAQEVEIATGKVLLQWRSNDHVPLSASYQSVPPAGPRAVWDYFHINCIAVDPEDDNLIISGRHTWSFYKVDRHSGDVIWRCGGRDSDFAMGPGTHFAFQHHVVAHPQGIFTIFDNEGGPPNEARQSRALVLRVDERRRDAWRGTPQTAPRLTVARRGHAARLYASWNGSTEHRGWRVLGGPGEHAMAPVGVSVSHGFETEIRLGHAPSHLAVEPLGGSGDAALARSAVVTVGA